MANDDAANLMRIEVMYAPAPHELHHTVVQLPAAATLGQALAMCDWWLALPSEHQQALQAGVWSRVCEHDAPLRDGDRVELYRPLQVDPKEARRQRYRRDGLRRAPRSGSTG
jgi:putative ubiquitin-RnfH superfamily antitoxin RatB of RatAB toxin-antitoxin module